MPRELKEASEPGDLVDRDTMEWLVASVEQLLAAANRKYSNLSGVAKPVGFQSPPPPAGLEGFVYAGPFAVADSESYTVNKFDYDLVRVCGGGETHSGLIRFSEIYKGRNTEEELTKGGYINTGVISIRPIANGKIVHCWWSTRKVGDDLKPLLLFSRDNEVIC
jgi:hypothetical protein